MAEGMVNSGFLSDGVVEPVVNIQADMSASISAADCQSVSGNAHASKTVDTVDRSPCVDAHHRSMEETVGYDTNARQRLNAADNTMARIDVVCSHAENRSSVDVGMSLRHASRTGNEITLSQTVGTQEVSNATDDAGASYALPSYSASVAGCHDNHQTSSSPSSSRMSLFVHRHKLCIECCLHCVVMTTSFRFLSAVIIMTGAGCVAAGVAVGARNVSAGSDYFTLAVMLVGQFVSLSVV